MAIHESTESDKFRVVIEQFLRERLDGKLDKLELDDPKRDALITQFQFDAWIEDAARRVTQIQAVTHSLKPIHPDARGTNLYCPPAALPTHAEVGSHSLGDHFAADVVGNAAALDVYKFLKLEVEGRSLLAWMLEGEPALAEAINVDPSRSRVLIDAFSGITRPRSDTAASNSLAKQLFWLAGDDPQSDSHFHLLAPLYASSLAHAVFQRVSEDRFGEAGKLARQARREQRDHDTGFHEYPTLAVQKLGGTKPQNISQLNSERGGTNYLLASLPPSWKSREVREPWMMESVFPRFGRRQDVRDLVRDLRKFLASNPGPIMQTRDRRDDFVDALIGELVMFAAELQSGLPAGWSSDAKCRLVESEQLWLDPGRAATDADFGALWLRMEWPDEIGQRFGNWLNKQLVDHLSVGDAEHRHWVRELGADQEWAWRVDQDRRRIDAAVATGGTP